MKLFRKLAGNIFFKIVLAFVALSFVLFGISGFLLNSPNSWVAKIGNKTISYNSFNKAMQADREMVLSASKSDEALKYLESERFKSDVLGRIVNRTMIEKLHENFGVSASKDLILAAVAKDPNFKNQEGKFDHEAFKKFLNKHGLDEEKYVNEVANEVVATMIIQTIALAAPINEKTVKEITSFQQEKRVADVIKISSKDVKSLPHPTDAEIEKFFSDNQKKYAVPELRKVSYLHFSKQNFAKDFQVSDKEISDYYQANQSQFQNSETRNFFHLLFEKESEAKDFIKKLDEVAKPDESSIGEEFTKLAKVIKNKDQKSITLSHVSQKDLIPELANPTFKLSLKQHSEAIKSPLGFHVFLLNEINQPGLTPLADVKGGIKEKLLREKEEKTLQAKIAEIDDLLLSSNSLEEVTKKFDLGLVRPAVKINQFGQNEDGQMVKEISGFADFAKNAFALKKGQASKVFYAQDSAGFYALKLDEIEPAREKALSEIKNRVLEDLLNQNRFSSLQELASEISKDLQNNPQKVTEIVAKYKVKIDKNREFPRIFYLEFQGRKVPYQNEFLEKLFDLQIGEPTPAVVSGEQEFVIGVLQEIKKPTIEAAQLGQAKNEAVGNFKTEILEEFNQFLIKKNPVQINEKLINPKSKSVQNEF